MYIMELGIKSNLLIFWLVKYEEFISEKYFKRGSPGGLMGTLRIELNSVDFCELQFPSISSPPHS